jgi:RNA polymerase sigma-70 factor (ECF subfamily)
MAAEVLADTRGALVVVEEALARLRREAERLPAGTPIPEIWLWLEVRRLALRQRHASRSKANPAEAPGGKFPLLVSWMPTQKDLAQLESRRALLKKLLRQLPRHQQQALALAVWEGLTEPEIAARLGEPLARVQSSLRAGMRFIRHRMNVVLGKWSVPI